jgi:hypothetical protein
MEPAETGDKTPLVTVFGRDGAAELVSEGPVRYLLVSGYDDAAQWGVIGAFWLSIDLERGGFVVNPDALWQGSEMARSFSGALRRGWNAERVYRFWQDQVGAAGAVMIDPQQHSDTLLHVYRRVGAL